MVTFFLKFFWGYLNCYKLISVASEIKSSMDDEVHNLADQTSKISDNADLLQKGINVLKYWNPNDNSREEEIKKECNKIKKDTNNTIKKYLLLWCIMIVATIIICIKFI